MLIPSSESEHESGDWPVAGVLHAAANSGSEEMFEAVLAAMGKAKLTPDEVLRFMFEHRFWGDAEERFSHLGVYTTTKLSIPLCSTSY